MLCKYYLHIGSVKVDIRSADCIDVSSMVANLSDLAVSYKRTGYNGVVRSCVSDIVFIGEAYVRLMELWQSDYYKSQASFAVYVINERWVYEPLWECPLDFSTFRYDSYRVTVGCVDKGAAALIRANQGTRYHYGAVGLSEDTCLNYDRVQVHNAAKMTIATGSTYDGDSRFTYFDVSDSSKKYVIPPIDLSDGDGITDGQGKLAISGVNLSVVEMMSLMGDYYFADELDDGVFSIDFTSFRVRLQSNVVLRFTFCYVGSGGNRLNSYTSENVNGVSVGGGWYEYACPIHGTFELKQGRKMGLYFTRRVNGELGALPTGRYLVRGGCVMDWVSRGKDIDMRVIRPVTLLNKLLRSIGGENSQIRGEIDDAENERLRNTMLLPAEEIRGFSGPTLYSSFKQFCEFMEAVFGYTYEIEEDAEVRETVTDALEILPISGRLVNSVPYTDGDEDLQVGSVWYVERGARFYGKLNGNFYYLFAGCEEYNNDNYDYHPYRNKIYYDTIACKAFKYEPTEDVGEWTSVPLVPYVLDEICIGFYDEIANFAGFEDDIDADQGEYLLQVEDSDVWFVRSRGKFFCKDENDRWYSDWDGAFRYNTSDGLRAKSIFRDITDDSGVYVAAQGKYLLFYGVDVDEVDPLPCASVVRFQHREKVFSDEVSMELERVSGQALRVSNDRLYSELRIGFDKQDYDLGNSGNVEWNFTNRYATDVRLSAKTLELISPYRADCYGIEEAAGKRSQETSASESDGDLWMVKVLGNPVNGRYVIDRSITVVGSYTDTVFNATYAPMFCFVANRSYLASFARRYTFASCDGNRNISFDDGSDTVGMGRSFVVNNGLFRIEDLEVETDDQMLPLDFSGLVEFAWCDKIYRGFVNSVEFNPQRPEVVKYELILKDSFDGG